MSKRKRQKTRITRQRSFYNLSEVNKKISDGEWLIRRNAMQDAMHDFGWDIDEIIKAFKRLNPNHFYKTDNSRMKHGLLLDIYKARINGENIYTHFYIDDQNMLVINSFKKDSNIK